MSTRKTLEQAGCDLAASGLSYNTCRPNITVGPAAAGHFCVGTGSRKRARGLGARLPGR